MSYTPTQWATGDTITAEKLNNMESGIENANEPFIVTLTPTAADFSGTMDKTVAEINAAYEAGQKIVFKVMENATSYIMADCSAQYFNRDFVYPSFNAYIVMLGVGIVFAGTGARNNGAFNGYETTIYPLTPMS